MLALVIAVTVSCFRKRSRPLPSGERGRGSCLLSGHFPGRELGIDQCRQSPGRLSSQHHPDVVVCQRRSVVQGRKRKDELTTPVGDIAEPIGEFGFQVPRQRQHHIWTVLVEKPWITNRDAHTWREAAMLVWITVDDVLEQIAADPAVVEQGVAVARRAVADDALAVGAALEQEPQYVVAERLGARPQLPITLDAV